MDLQSEACFTYPMSKTTFTWRAPVSHYILAIAFGAMETIAVSLAVGASNPHDFWLAAGVGALTTAYPAVSLGGWIFVFNHTVTRDAHGEQSVELTWMKRAASGAFLDVLIATLVVTVVLMIGRFPVDALPVLLALTGLSAVDAGLRYLVNRYRALR
jgi:hypothetical protein